jgi:putative ABC transport system substrate-binding protein
MPHLSTQSGLARKPVAGIGRREFLIFVGSTAAVAWPHAALSQQAGRVRRIAVLMTQGANDSEAKGRLAAFRQELVRLGWAEGRNLHIDYRFASGETQRNRDYAAELVSLNPDVILANGNAILVALREHTREIPIVFVLVPDPVGDGLVDSLARPGNNLTGFTNFEFSMGANGCSF